MFRIDADVRDVALLVRSLYTGKIELCPNSVEKIIDLCKMLKMEEDSKFYEEVVKKELTKLQTTVSQINVKSVTPIYRVHKRADGVVLNYLEGLVAEDVSAQHVGSGDERTQIVGGNLGSSLGDTDAGVNTNLRQMIVKPYVDEVVVKEEPEENQQEGQSG